MIPKMFGFLYARYVGFATGIAILYCSQNKIESYPKAVYKTITPGNIEEFVLWKCANPGQRIVSVGSDQSDES